MKLAVSTIAWPEGRDADAADTLARLGVRAIEVAPRKIWPDPSNVDDAAIDEHRRWWADRGFAIVAAQALLFGRPDLTLFQDAGVRARTLDYLKGVIRTCGRLGAKSLVFGSPKNRIIAPRSADEVEAESVDFFGQLASCAVEHGTTVVVEANPPRYGADYLTNAESAAGLVRRVNHPGLRWHLDTACMAIAGDPVAETIRTNADILGHVHLSEPDLAPLGSGGIDHPAFAAELRAVGYAGWLSIEMRAVDPFDVATLVSAVAVARAAYAAVGNTVAAP
ncbi:MAG: sugar phosphate isomerase/epimerase [Gemmataceae bacterium]|nr:sugar phosphate isomerase/epimerase [Gemmataceae bacterium]